MSQINFQKLYAGYFQVVYQAAPASTRGSESEYKDYVEKFYKGSWVADGWLEQTEDAVKTGGMAVRTLMNTLGQRICGEWAKPNKIRTVTTDHLKAWGKEAKASNGLGSIEKRLAKVESMLPRPLIPVVSYKTLTL